MTNDQKRIAIFEAVNRLNPKGLDEILAAVNEAIEFYELEPPAQPVSLLQPRIATGRVVKYSVRPGLIIDPR